MKIITCREKKKRDPFISFTLVQTVCAVLIIAAVILAAKYSPSIFLKMREQFGKLNTGDYDIIAAVSEKAVSVFADYEETSTAAPPEVKAEVMSNTVTAEEITLPPTTEDEAEEIPVMPVNGVVTSPYGTRIHPFYNTESFHSGRDIAADEGTDIISALEGVVSVVGVGQNSGNYIKLKHENGYETLYCHCSAIYASEGQTVKKGEVIAAVGHTGLATGPHLHFEVHKNGQLIDPAELLDKTANEY